MTTKQADKLIKQAAVVTMIESTFNEIVIGKPVDRDRWTIKIEYVWNGKTLIGVFDRQALEVK